MKLTLNIEPCLITQIKELAKKRNTRISKIAENYFKKEIAKENVPFIMKTESELPEWIKGLSIAGEQVPDFDHKTEYHRHMQEKYDL